MRPLRKSVSKKGGFTKRSRMYDPEDWKMLARIENTMWMWYNPNANTDIKWLEKYRKEKKRTNHRRKK